MTYASTILSDNPLHWWRCNEGPGALAMCDSGSQKAQLYPQAQGPNVGTPTINPAMPVPNYGFGYEGVTSDGGACAMFMVGFIMYDPGSGAGHNPATGFVAPGTLEYWSYQDASVYSHNLGWYTGSPASSANTWAMQRLGASVSFFDFGLAIPTPQLLASDAAWHHLVLTWSTTSVSQYIDGAIKQTLSLSSAVSSSSLASFAIASLPTPTGQPQVAGMFAEVAVYGSQLSSGAVGAHFSAAEMRGHVPKFRGVASTDFHPTPTGVSADVTHSGLTATGEIVLTSLFGIGSLLTTIPASYGRETAEPTFYFELGWLSVITAQGVVQNFRLDRTSQFLLLPPLTTAIGWTLSPGVVLELTEYSATF